MTDLSNVPDSMFCKTCSKRIFVKSDGHYPVTGFLYPDHQSAICVSCYEDELGYKMQFDSTISR